MGLASMFYQHIGKRTSTFAMAICVGAIGFERGFDRFEYFESSLVLDNSIYAALLITSGRPTTKASYGKISE